MTNMQHKPNGWNEPLNRMTEDEWKEYFRIREELDVEMTEEEIKEHFNLIEKLLSEGKEKDANCIYKLIPLGANCAYFIKKCHGLDAVSHFNLSEAKKEFPGEF